MLGLAELGTWATVFAGLCDDCDVIGLQDALHRCPGLQTGMFAIGLSRIGSGSAGAAVAVGLECGVGWACSWPHWFVCGPTDPRPSPGSLLCLCGRTGQDGLPPLEDTEAGHCGCSSSP